jgi:hypothetical protein
MQHQCVALDFPTKSAAPTAAVFDSVAMPTLGTTGRAIYEVWHLADIPSCTAHVRFPG